MGIYINPGNQAFSRIAGKNYVDKPKLIEAMNERVGGDESLVCISRPRLFGKSYAAKMLSAYYDCSCDSYGLFDDKKIAESESYERHLNQYNVICLDISGFISIATREKIPFADIPSRMAFPIKEEVLSIDPTAPKDYRRKKVIGNLSLNSSDCEDLQAETLNFIPITFQAKPQKWSRYSSFPFHFFSGMDLTLPS